jgi:SRSO17 transposase
MNKSAKEKIYDTNRWGFNSEAVAELGKHLHKFWKRFTDKFKTKTRNAAVYALFYMKGLLLMEEARNYANLSRRVVDHKDDGQKIQHFMSDSPWSSEAVIKQVQEEIKETAGLEEGYLLLDESAGAGRQHNDRLGKVEMSQVGVFLAYFKDIVWNWIDGELYIPENWFKKEMESTRNRVGIPKERKFATKVQLGWQMIERVKQRGLQFKSLACDDLYGRSGWLRKNMSEAGIVYMAEVPEDTLVYLSKPDYRVPSVSESKKSRKLKRAKILNDITPLKASELAKESASDFERILVRNTERGDLNDNFLVRRVWTIREKELAEEWLIIRHEYGKKYTYALSNADKDTPKEELAKLKCVRHFIERANQDIKSEIGWDELQARKYQAWYHHLAMTIMSMWFISQLKHEWSNKYPRDSKLSEELKVKLLPALSVANVRELLKAVMPLQQLTPEQATSLVVSHLVNRSYSTASRLKTQAIIQASG